jgi:hypothetical protein
MKVQQLFLKDGHFNLLFIYSFEYAYTEELVPYKWVFVFSYLYSIIPSQIQIQILVLISPQSKYMSMC